MFHRIGCIALLIAVAVPGYAQTNTVEEWRKQVSLRLSSSKRFPPGAFDQNGTARVDFVLDRHGKLVSHWLVESTGHRALDEESLAIIERAQPFPIPPPDLDEGGLRMGVPFVFSARSARHRDSGPDIRNNPEILRDEAKVNATMKSICRGC